MTKKKITLFGGTGFVGSFLANQLLADNHEVNIITRSRERARHLWPLPNVQVIEADVYNPAKVSGLVQNSDVVINLVGILNERKDNGSGFRRAHVELTSTLLAACQKAHVGQYLHMSALNADPFAASYYLRTKGEAEKLVLAAQSESLAVHIFRPSLIFGVYDSLFNRFAKLLRITPVFFPLACARTKFQPVYVGDVADAFIKIISERPAGGIRYDIGGPEVKSLLEIVNYTNELCRTKRIIVPLGNTLSKIQANVFEYVPGKPFSRDNFRSAKEDSVCVDDNGLDDLNIPATPIEAIVPTYLGGTERMRYDRMRRAAHRNR